MPPGWAPTVALAVPAEEPPRVTAPRADALALLAGVLLDTVLPTEALLAGALLGTLLPADEGGWLWPPPPPPQVARMQAVALPAWPLVPVWTAAAPETPLLPLPDTTCAEAAAEGPVAACAAV